MKKPTIEEFLSTWAICPECKTLYSGRMVAGTSNANEECMDMQLSYTCFGTLRQVTEQDYQLIKVA
jgi:hypothetical protein